MDEPKPMRELTRIREEQGLSQQGLADASGVNKATINQIERGRRSPNLETLEKLASALVVEVADFFPKAQAELPDFEELSIPELKHVAKGLWAEWRERAAYDRVSRSYSLEDAEHLAEIQRKLTAVTSRMQKLDPPLATILQRLDGPTKIIYHRPPTSEEQARLRAEYPDAVEVEDAILVY
jgi:transcriptional regulator with XRE-family HTH domain